MPVNIASADQVKTRGRGRASNSDPYNNSTSDYSNGSSSSGVCRTARALRRSRAAQVTPRFDLVTEVMAVDLEGCQRNGVHYDGNLAVANDTELCVYDTFTDHGGYQTDEQFIHQLPPIKKRLGVYWRDLAPWNGAQPIKEVIQHFIDLAAGRTIVFHDAAADKRMLEASAGMCGLTIPWADIKVRDTQKFPGYWMADSQLPGPSLKKAVKEFLGFDIQVDEHTAFEDAAKTMALYQLSKAAIEAFYAPAPAVAVPAITKVQSEVQTSGAKNPSASFPLNTEVSTSEAGMKTLDMTALEQSVTAIDDSAASTTVIASTAPSSAPIVSSSTQRQLNSNKATGELRSIGKPTTPLAAPQTAATRPGQPKAAFSWAQVASNGKK